MDQTLYLETYGLSLRKDGGVLKVLEKGRLVRGLPAINVGAVVIFSEGVSISGGAVRLCNEKGIPIFFMSRNGGAPSVLAPVEARWPERQAAQIRAADDPVSVHAVCRGLVGAKIRNQLSLMKYFRNSRKMGGGPFEEKLSDCGAVVKKALAEMKSSAPDGDAALIRGRFFSMEGRAATRYWEAASYLLQENMGFPGRRRKGAEDPVNRMLNYGYAILGTKTHHAILRAGLSSYFSFLHSHQPNRANLVYDLMEPFRPWAVDRVILGMCSKGPEPKIDKNGMAPETRRELISRLEKRWEKDGLVSMLDRQAMALRRVTEDGLDVMESVVFQANGTAKGPAGVDGRGRKKEVDN